jgi:hypothetical protein
MSSGAKRLEAYKRGHPRPTFESVDVLPRSWIIIAEEEVLHPEQVVYVSLSQVTEEGEVVGELLLSVPQLRALAADLAEDLQVSYRPGMRRWRGSGPALNFGEESDHILGGADG